MDRMRTLHSCLCWNTDAHKPQRIIEDPTPEQAEILAALGFKIASGGLTAHRRLILCDYVQIGQNTRLRNETPV